MGLGQATAMVVGIIIGASIFVQPSEIARLVPSTTGVMLVWVGAGLLTFFGALACAELASAFPRTGGVYVFLKETYSPALGFKCVCAGGCSRPFCFWRLAHGHLHGGGNT